MWDGRDVLFVGGTRTGLAYSPARDAWRTLPRAPARRREATVIRAGRRVLVWGGSSGGRTGLEYVPGANRWFSFGEAPIKSRLFPAVAWTGSTFLIFGGLGASDGAAWTP